jgi:enamine deaminase RidA (YjgF/YER057c/UK114 family)
MALFADMNEAYKQYWGDVKPARTCVAAKQLPLGTDVEIECQAVVVVGNGKS